jgi:hypothetical protein
VDADGLRLTRDLRFYEGALTPAAPSRRRLPGKDDPSGVRRADSVFLSWHHDTHHFLFLVICIGFANSGERRD